MSQQSSVSRRSSKNKPAASSGSDSRRFSESRQKSGSLLQPSNSEAAPSRIVIAAIDVDECSSEPETPQRSVSDVEVAVKIPADAKRNELETLFHAAGAPASATSFSVKDEFTQLRETLRQEFRDSFAELQAAQSAAATAQSDVLRTLTDVILQTSASTDISPESLERAFSGVEDRLIARIAAAAKAVPSAESLTSEMTMKPGTKSASPSTHVKLQNAANSVNRSWAQIRGEMMAKDEFSESPASQESQSSERLHEATQLSSDRHFRLPEQDPSLEIPKSVDPESVSVSELRDAFRERELFIATLIARIRRQQELATGQLSSEQLRMLVNDVPEELATQVKHTLKQMDDLARMGELELSMERARIARQVNQLEHSRQIIERNAQQLGWDLNSDGTFSPPARPHTRASSSSRRWLGKLGFGQ